MVNTHIISTVKVHPLELPRRVSGPVQLQWGQGRGAFPPAGQGHRFTGHPAARTLHMCRVGHGEWEMYTDCCDILKTASSVHAFFKPALDLKFNRVVVVLWDAI